LSLGFLMPLEILQIVPHLPPSISGVGDYACLLAAQMQAAHGLSTKFFVCDPSWRGDPEINGFSVERFDSHDASELALRLAAPDMPDMVLLHYVGYGYHKRGCPLWLARGLRSWKKALPGRCLVVMLHELYASGPPWSSSFWTSPIQRALVKSFVRMSAHTVTNLQSSRRLLARIMSNSANDFSVFPVFSNVGEPPSLPHWGNRRPRLVVFGNPAWRRQAYVEHQTALEDACAAFGLEEIVDIGSPCGVLPKFRVPVVLKGNLPAEEISAQLLNARAGFFTYPAAYLGKSGVFAAYAAHGVAPLTYAKNVAANGDGLSERDHFISTGSWYSYGAGELQRVGVAARAWYANHAIDVQAKGYSEIFQLLDREIARAAPAPLPVAYETEKLTA